MNEWVKWLQKSSTKVSPKHRLKKLRSPSLRKEERNVRRDCFYDGVVRKVCVSLLLLLLPRALHNVMWFILNSKSSPNNLHRRRKMNPQWSCGRERTRTQRRKEAKQERASQAKRRRHAATETCVLFSKNCFSKTGLNVCQKQATSTFLRITEPDF